MQRRIVRGVVGLFAVVFRKGASPGPPSPMAYGTYHLTQTRLSTSQIEVTIKRPEINLLTLKEVDPGYRVEFVFSTHFEDRGEPAAPPFIGTLVDGSLCRTSSTRSRNTYKWFVECLYHPLKVLKVRLCYPPGTPAIDGIGVGIISRFTGLPPKLNPGLGVPLLSHQTLRHALRFMGASWTYQPLTSPDFFPNSIRRPCQSTKFVFGETQISPSGSKGNLARSTSAGHNRTLAERPQFVGAPIGTPHAGVPSDRNRNRDGVLHHGGLSLAAAMPDATAVRVPIRLRRGPRAERFADSPPVQRQQRDTGVISPA